MNNGYEDELNAAKEVRARLTRLLADCESKGLDDVAEDVAKSRTAADKAVKELRTLQEEFIKSRQAA